MKQGIGELSVEEQAEFDAIFAKFFSLTESLAPTARDFHRLGEIYLKKKYLVIAHNYFRAAAHLENASTTLVDEEISASHIRPG